MDEDALSLLQTRMGGNDSATEDALDLDSSIAGKGTPPRRRRAPPPPTPHPTPPPTQGVACNGIKLNQFAGTKFQVSQTSTLYSLAQTHMGVKNSSLAQTHVGVNDSKVVGQNLDSTLADKDGGHITAPTYTYTITIGGEIHQQTSDAGDYFLGTHSSYGDMVEHFTNGQKCGNTPRQATVTFIVGPEMTLISAKEPSTCVYQFVVQLPEDHCGLPMTPLDNLEINEDGVDEEDEERRAEEENVHECASWCNNKKKASIPWFRINPKDGSVNDPFKCGWFKCSDCCQCTGEC